MTVATKTRHMTRHTIVDWHHDFLITEKLHIEIHATYQLNWYGLRYVSVNLRVLLAPRDLREVPRRRGSRRGSLFYPHPHMIAPLLEIHVQRRFSASPTSQQSNHIIFENQRSFYHYQLWQQEFFSFIYQLQIFSLHEHLTQAILRLTPLKFVVATLL